MDIIEKMSSCSLKKEQIALVWLGQAGFIFMDPRGRKIAVDPYLSHCGEARKNFVRMSPILIEPNGFHVDAVLITHKHFDHFDYDAIPEIAQKTQAQFYGPISCVREFERLNISGKEMILLEAGAPGKKVAPEMEIKAVFADHGQLEPNAVGLQLQINGFWIYITGDTAFCPDQMIAVKDSLPDILVASVNGEFGNLDQVSGAQLANYTGAKAMIPCHFWTFKEHKGRPDLLQETMEQQDCTTELQFLTPGEVYICTKTPEGRIIFLRRRATN